MAVRTDDSTTDYQTIGMDATELGQYADVSLDDGQVIIYDKDNEEAWVQSHSAIGVEFMR